MRLIWNLKLVLVLNLVVAVCVDILYLALSQQSSLPVCLQVRWNACYAFGNVFRNPFLPTGIAPWTVSIMNSVRQLVYRRVMCGAERCSKNSRLAEKRSFEAVVKFWGQSLSRGHYHPLYKQAREGFIYYTTLRLISETCALYCGKDQTASDGHSVIAAK